MTTITQALSTLPDAPDPATDSPANFSSKAAAMVLAIKAMVVELQTWTSQANTVKTEINASEVATAADVLSTAADALATAADRVQTGLDRTAAAASASTAAGYANALTGTSSTSNNIAIGSKSFTAESGKQWATGQFLLAASAANSANFMHGQVTSYNSTTGALVLNVLDVGGSGTKTDWVISLSAPKGDPGAAGVTSYLTRVEVSGTTQTCADGYEYWAENAGATAFTANASPVDGERFAVVPVNGLFTNTIDFGSATVRGPAGTVTGVLTLNLGARMEFRYSTTLFKWVVL
ncbi:MAG: hypothetical protein WAW73_19640 [Rhodoferax sp.]